MNKFNLPLEEEQQRKKKVLGSGRYGLMTGACAHAPCTVFMTDTNRCVCALCPQEHFNYYSVDGALGHLVFSLKYDVIGDQEHLRLMLR